MMKFYRSRWALFVGCILVSGFTEVPQVDMVSGSFTVEADGVLVKNSSGGTNFNKQQTAEEAAINQALLCKCETPYTSTQHTG